MPAAFRMRLRPPSHPTRYFARNDWPSDSSTSTPVSSCVVMPGGKVADVQTDRGEARDLGHLSLRDEPIGDATLIENLDGA